MKRTGALWICAVILLAAAGVVALIFSTEPTAQRAGATKETAMLVDVLEVERGAFRPTVVAMGTVEPARDVVLSPRISGEVVELAKVFTPGGFVREGEVLLRIDPADFRTVLAQRESELRQARAELQLEMGRQDVARRDYELLDEALGPDESLAPEGGLSGEDLDLVLRRPQLETAKAQVDMAQAAVEQAELNLGRTTIRAPFDAHILARDVNVGSQVAPGDRLGRLVGTDEYWVEVAVPMSKLRFISLPGERGAADDERGAEVRVRNRTAWPEETYRTGYVDQLLGDVSGETRMARVLVTVPDPLARSDASPALMIGSFLEARIEAEELADVVRLSRDYVRKDDTVWVMEDGELRIREADIVFRDERYVYVAEGLETGDRVVVTNLSTVVDGAALRLEEAER